MWTELHHVIVCLCILRISGKCFREMLRRNFSGKYFRGQKHRVLLMFLHLQEFREIYKGITPGKYFWEVPPGLPGMLQEGLGSSRRVLQEGSWGTSCESTKTITSRQL